MNGYYYGLNKFEPIGVPMRTMKSFLAWAAMLSLLVGACAAPEPKAPSPDEFMTLADVTGRVTLQEDSPDVRVIRVKSKAFIKRNDIRAAKAKAIESAQTQALEMMIQELLLPETYNNKYEIIEEYISKNFQKYVL